MLQNNLDDDLTTDAIPSPPRDEIKKENVEVNEEPEHINTQPKVKTKTGSKKPKMTTFSNVTISNSQGIHFGPKYTIHLKNKTESSTPNYQDQHHVVTPAIQSLFKSDEVVERKHLIFLHCHINEEWRSTARLLDYSDGQISQFYQDYCNAGIKEVIYQLFLDWIQNEADAATIGKLSRTLWDTNQQDAVKRWSESKI